MILKKDVNHRSSIQNEDKRETNDDNTGKDQKSPLNKVDGIHSEKLRYKNADEIYD